MTDLYTGSLGRCKRTVIDQTLHCLSITLVSMPRLVSDAKRDRNTIKHVLVDAYFSRVSM